MKAVRIIIAVVLTSIVLVVAGRNSRGRSEPLSYEENGISFEMITVPKWEEKGLAYIPIKVTGGDGDSLRVQLRVAKFKQDLTTPRAQFATAPMGYDSTTGEYIGQIQCGSRGGRTYWYVEVRDRVGGLRASLLNENGDPFTLKFIGIVPAWILISHIVLMFVTVFFVALSGVHAVQFLRGKGELRPMLVSLLWGVIAAFLGGYPFGFAMNWYAFGTIWEGVPFGTDATDNKTQLLFVYMLFVLLAGIRTLTKGKIGRDTYSAEVLARFGVGSIFVMLAIYLIPHSIQFSPELTKTVCWSFIGLVALIYFGGLAFGNKGKNGPRRARARKQ
ncbi:MAG TPA: hypothetical protein PLF13_10340 [candidate division Zixibacteria bacterium]|nr:hypothetical protein [candidate division Zixibacteria bacterium]